jgi:hypothetical protein
MPLMLPWLALLGLFLLRTNRSGHAWSIWVALIVACGLGMSLSKLLVEFPSEVQEMLSEAVISLAFGLGAVWLLAPSLSVRPRFLTLLSMFGVLAGFSIFSGLVRADLGEGTGLVVPLLFMLGMGALAMVLGMVLANRVCRNGFGWLRVILGWLVGLIVSWILVLAPWFVLVTVMDGGSIRLSEFFMGVFLFTGMAFVAVLPYLILSFAHPFYGERLRSLMQPKDRVVPPVVEASPV